jgi:hypothetical protein
MEVGEDAAIARTREGAAAWPARSIPLVGGAGSVVDARRKEAPLMRGRCRRLWILSGGAMPDSGAELLGRGRIMGSGVRSPLDRGGT